MVLNWHLWRGRRCSSRCRQSPEPSASALPLCCPSSYVVRFNLTIKEGQIWLKIKTRFAFLFGWFLDSWLFSIPDIAKFLHLLVHTYIFLDCDLSLESYENPRGSFRHCPHKSQPNHYTPIWRKGPYQLWSPVKTGVWWEKAALEGSAQKRPPQSSNSLERPMLPSQIHRCSKI